MRASQRRGVVAAALCTIALAAGFAAGPASAAPKAAAASPKAGKSIIGGRAAESANWQFQVAILRKGRLHCGGAVIAPTKILTAAHCALGFSVAQLSVVVGRSRLSDATGESIAVASSAVHPDYANTFRHDVAVLTLQSPTSAPTLALPTVEQAAAATQTGALLRVAGFGARNPFGFRLSNVLIKTVERVRTNKRCRRAYRSVFSGTAMICAMGKRLGKYKRIPIHTSACSGDSGGPLVADTPTGPIVVGTVSYGSSLCGYSGSPTVYARVSDALPFIETTL